VRKIKAVAAGPTGDHGQVNCGHVDSSSWIASVDLTRNVIGPPWWVGLDSTAKSSDVKRN